MEQRTVKVSKIRITKSDLLSMCENERVFFIQSGDLLNDLNVFSKLLMFCMNRQRADIGGFVVAPIGGLLFVAGLPVTGGIMIGIGTALIVVEAYEYFTRPPGEDAFRDYAERLNDGIYKCP